MRKSLLIFAAFSLIYTASAGAAEVVRGEVKAIDTSAGTITLKHGPITSLGMDVEMTMMFHADSAMLREFKIGDHVSFEAANVNGQLTVIAIHKAK